MTTLAEPRNSVKPARAPRRPAPPTHGSASMQLTIRAKGKATAYTVKPIKPDPESGVSRAYSFKKAGGETYVVSQHEHGAECDCPDWVYSRDGIDPSGCKHIKAAVAF